MRKDRSFQAVDEPAEPQHCPLCTRVLIPGPTINEHHLIPRLKGGKNGPTVILHKVCHGAIHSRFTESELARTYNTIEKLLEDDTIQRFVVWVSKKAPEFYDSSRDTKVRKNKRHK